MVKLTRNELPGFIFLIDEISRDVSNADYSNVFTQIAYEGQNMNHKVVGRTIRRAFNLRKNLKEGAIKKADFNLPTITTLNVLTAFYTEQQVKRFKTLLKKNEKEIQSHYEQNQPSNSIIENIFSPPEKIKKIDDTKDKLHALLEELDNMSLEEFLNFWIHKKLGELQKEKSDQEFKEEMFSFVEKCITRVEKKRKKATLFYRLFGLVGLSFIAFSEYDDIKSFIVENYTKDQDVLLDEDQDDDDLLDYI